MLEDDLREMFSARVRTPPSALDPAGTAISRGRRGARVRRLTVLTMSCFAFVAMLAGAATIKGMWTKPADFADALTYDGLFGDEVEQPERGGEQVDLPVVKVPIDVYAGTSLWTSDGRKLTMTGVTQVIEVVRVPAGWLYFDDFRLRLLTTAGQSVQVRDSITSWAVSRDGSRVASVASENSLEIAQPGGAVIGQTPVPQATQAVGFVGGHAILRHGSAGYDEWEGGEVYKQAWNTRLLAVYGSGSDEAVGLVEEKGSVCLVDVIPTGQGWQIAPSRACGEVLRPAGRDRLGRTDISLSSDGRWLAIPSESGVQIIDVNASRSMGEPVVKQVCQSQPNAPAVWADDKTLLSISHNSGIVACGMDGSRGLVELPSGVSTGWALVPRYGVA